MVTKCSLHELDFSEVIYFVVTDFIPLEGEVAKCSLFFVSVGDGRNSHCRYFVSRYKDDVNGLEYSVCV